METVTISYKRFRQFQLSLNNIEHYMASLAREISYSAVKDDENIKRKIESVGREIHYAKQTIEDTE